MKIDKRRYVTNDICVHSDLWPLSEAEHIHPNGFPNTVYIEAYSHAWWVVEAEIVVDRMMEWNLRVYGEFRARGDLPFASAWEGTQR